MASHPDGMSAAAGVAGDWVLANLKNSLMFVEHWHKKHRTVSGECKINRKDNKWYEWRNGQKVTLASHWLRV